MLAAYAVSGFAGLVYELTWTRLLALRLGHTTAAASTVLAAFMGGLAVGAAVGGRLIAGRTPRQARLAYAGLEAVVLGLALLLPWSLDALNPLLRWAYADGEGTALFVVARSITSMLALFIPALALGATFPCAVKAWADDGAGRTASRLYAVNTAGAALGAVAAGFWLIPDFGTTGATAVAVTASALSIALSIAAREAKTAKTPSGVRHGVRHPSDPVSYVAWTVVALTGSATFILEIGWTRLFALLVGPSTYAFAAVLTLCIAGLALGAAIGARVVATSRSAAALPVTLALAALFAAAGTLLAGQAMPRWIAEDIVSGSRSFLGQLAFGAGWMALVIVPVMGALGATFPMALTLGGRGPDRGRSATLGVTYAINTAAGVAGALAGGFAILPAWGIEGALRTATGALIAAALASFVLPARGARRALAAGVTIAALAAVVARSSWDRPLLASGAYKYGRYLPSPADLDLGLTAGQLLYYRDGAAATVSVKEVTGERSMSIDAKVDASTGRDMVTQKLLAHLPLLLHEDPETVCIIGLGSGVTLGSALVHPIAAADVIELSPEVIEASRFFERENHGALDNPRTHLIVGDGRSHLALTEKRYDVIVSEPSNPWMAGVAALFTQEFFAAARDRLAPGGIICQWAHTYDISATDLRSIVATFLSVFPDGTMWLVGSGDLLLVGSDGPLDNRLGRLATHWQRAGVADDLAAVDVSSPFALLSSFIGAGREMKRYAAAAPIQRDRLMALEFSGPAAVNDPANDNQPALLALQDEGRAGAGLTQFIAAAPPDAWRQRGAMLARAGAFDLAYESYARAASGDPADLAAAMGVVDMALPARRIEAAGELLNRLAEAHPDAGATGAALSKWRASTGDVRGAILAAADSCRAPDAAAEACAQLASIYIDAGDSDALAVVVDTMQVRFPGHVDSLYAEAALSFLRGDLAAAKRLGGRAVAADGNRSAAWNLLGAVAATSGDAPAARQAFQKSLTLAPRDTTTYLNLARLELTDGDRGEAARRFAEALVLDPASTAAREGLHQAGGM